MLVYKIHPAIGIARVGDHPSAFFIGPEVPGKPGVEIDAAGAENPIGKYKDAGRIKRQAARFRIFEYEVDLAGVQTLQREITANEATIEWKVDLVNRKAALEHTPPNPADPQSAGRRRNNHLAGAARDTLVIHDSRSHTISGANAPAFAFDQGTFLGVPVYLGELRTDAQGRLLVLGGHGKAQSVPPGKPVGSGAVNAFANNDFWCDDVADGPVTAMITFPDQAPLAVQFPAWVTVAPPDYAPGIGGVITLYDVVFQAAIDAGFVAPDPQPSFRRHILPMIERAAELRFVQRFNAWNRLPRDASALSQPGPTAAILRGQAADFLTGLSSLMRNVVIPPFLRTYIGQYKVGTFIDDLAGPMPTASVPEDLDRSALEGGVGHSFFPGIEASFNLRDRSIYAEAFRINHSAPGVRPGFLTEIMAVPWQSDFLKCQEEGGKAWWPSQRPDILMRDKNNIPGSQDDWLEGIIDHQDMVDRFASLSFVVPQTVGGETVHVQET